MKQCSRCAVPTIGPERARVGKAGTRSRRSLLCVACVVHLLRDPRRCAAEGYAESALVDACRRLGVRRPPVSTSVRAAEQRPLANSA